MIFFDTETFLIAPGCQAPPLVCLQWCEDDGPAQLVHARDPAARREVERWLTSSTIIAGHHVAFDAAVLCAQWPDLVPAVFAAYAADRVTCTKLRQTLIWIAKGVRKDKTTRADLGSLSAFYSGPTLDKADPWRLRYGTLIDTPTEQWPAEALSYALLDAEATRAVWRGQEAYSSLLADQFRQARAGFWLRLMECWGLAVDGAQAERYVAQTQTDLDRDREIAQLAGMIRPDGTRNTKAAMARMVDCARDADEPIPLTATGLDIAEAQELSPAALWEREGKYVALDEETVERLGDAELEAYQRASTAATRITRAERLLRAARAGAPIQASFDPLVDTGRTSCRQGDSTGPLISAYGAQVQNPQRAPGYREIFVPRPDCALVSIDYPTLELRCFAQECLERVGSSELAVALNAGRDPHSELGARVAKIKDVYALKRAGGEPWKQFEKTYRFFAKAANFGFPGGMGAKRFCASLVRQAVQSRSPATIALARAFSLEEAYALRDAWSRQWPETKEYFAAIAALFAESDSRATITHALSERVRGGLYYSQACNSPFQGRAADLAKDAGFRIARECYAVRSSPLYGSRIVNFVHDEFLLEILLSRLHPAAYRATELMVAAGRDWCPDLSFEGTVPCAMDRWSKDAATILDSAGRLAVYHVRLD